MNFKDQWSTTENGEKFIFTVEMQRKLSKAGLPIEPDSLSQLVVERPSKRYAEPEQAGGERPLETPRHTPPPAAEQADDFDEPLTIQIDPQTGKYIGRLKWYNAKKGYGFLVRAVGEEIFFHKTSTVGNPEELEEGQWVLYDVEETNKGLEATEIEPYEGDVSLLS